MWKINNKVMSCLSEVYIKRSTLETMLKVLEKKNQDGISLQIGINDETSQYGTNVSVSVSQTKEERESKKDKFYIGNGKCFWHDGKITKAEKMEKEIKGNDSFTESSDLPF